MAPPKFENISVSRSIAKRLRKARSTLIIQGLQQLSPMVRPTIGPQGITMQTTLEVMLFFFEQHVKTR